MSQPRLFDDQGLAPLLDAHLLQEHVHDDEHHDGEKHGVVLYLVDFEDDEALVEEVHAHVGVERGLQLAAPVELLEDGREVSDAEVYLFERHYLGDALQRELVVGVEGQLPDFQAALLLLHTAYLSVYADEHGVLVQFLAVFLHDARGVFLLGLRGGAVAHEGQERAALPDEFDTPYLRGERRQQGRPLIRRLLCAYHPVDVSHLAVVPVVVVLYLGVDKELPPQAVALVVREPLERVEIGVVILHEGLVHNHVLYLGGEGVSLEDEEDERLEEILLLPEVLFVFLPCHLEGVHGDGAFLRVGYVGAAEVAADALVGVARVDHDHIRSLFEELAHHAVHVEYI